MNSKETNLTPETPNIFNLERLKSLYQAIENLYRDANAHNLYIGNRMNEYVKEKLSNFNKKPTNAPNIYNSNQPNLSSIWSANNTNLPTYNYLDLVGSK